MSPARTACPAIWPCRKEPAGPGVIILHERYGFVQHPREVAERFARLGMAGFAINGFFKCDFQSSLADGTKRYYMTDPESVDYMTSAVEALKATGRVDTAKIAVLGMCQTGRHPFVMAANSDLIAAAICWYGGGIEFRLRNRASTTQAADRHSLARQLSGTRAVRRKRQAYPGRQRPPHPRSARAIRQVVRDQRLWRCAARLPQRPNARALP